LVAMRTKFALDQAKTASEDGSTGLAKYEGDQLAKLEKEADCSDSPDVTSKCKNYQAKKKDYDLGIE